MCQASTDRAAISNLVMGHVADRRLQQWMALRQSLVRLDVAPAHPGAQAHSVVVDLDLVETGQFAHINEQRRSGETKRQNRQQTLAAGDQLRVAVVQPEQPDRLGKRIRTSIFEWRRFHAGGGVPTRP